MKKTMLICFVLLSAKTFAQNSDKGFVQGMLQRLEFGVMAGANYSNFTNASFSTDPLTGFHVGGVVGFKITKHFSIQEDFLFSTEGAKNKSDAFERQDISLYYIRVPFLIRYKSNLGLFAEAGPQVGMKIKEDVSWMPGGQFAKNVDAGIVGGIGYQSKIGLGIGARYIYGISNVGNFNNATIKNNFNNNNVQVSVFYIF